MSPFIRKMSQEDVENIKNTSFICEFTKTLTLNRQIKEESDDQRRSCHTPGAFIHESVYTLVLWSSLCYFCTKKMLSLMPTATLHN